MGSVAPATRPCSRSFATERSSSRISRPPPYTLTCQEPARPGPAGGGVAVQRPFLELLGPNGERRSVDLGPERLTVGRLHDLNDIALEPDLQLLVTRQVHCVIERGEDGGWYVADNGSVNGTFVRRERTGAMEQVE